MKAHYDTSQRTYTITDLDARDAHILIWGGTQPEIDAAEEKLRQALVKAEDGQMPDAHYRELVLP